jgi:hypothetical protein
LPGADPSLYGLHSLRIGVASALFALNCSPLVRQSLGRWQSDIYELYCGWVEGVARSAFSATIQALVAPCDEQDEAEGSAGLRRVPSAPQLHLKQRDDAVDYRGF